MERVTLETPVSKKEITRLTNLLRDQNNSIHTLHERIVRDTNNWKHYLGEIQYDASAREKGIIEALKDNLEKKKEERDKTQQKLDALLADQNRLQQLHDVRTEMEIVNDESNKAQAKRAELSALIRSIPSEITKLDWALNSVLLPKAAQVKERLQVLERS
jgi:chromosome segregation ATPase